MRKPLALVLIVLLLATMACSINLNTPNVNLKTGPTETFTVKEPAPAGNDTVHMEIAMGAGKLDLTGGASGLVEGTVRYNVAGWKPTITRSGNDLIIEQKNMQVKNLPTRDIINEWKLQLGSKTPLDLEVKAGAYEGNLDLGGVPLRNLTVTDGASKSEVHFESMNPERMDKLEYKTGASQVSLFNLANANFDEMSFESGAGSYTLDFGGTLQQDATVDIKSGVSAMTIVVPNGMAVRLDQSGAMNSVDIEGTWQKSGSVYQTTGTGSTLTIHVDMGVGTLKLVQK